MTCPRPAGSSGTQSGSMTWRTCSRVSPTTAREQAMRKASWEATEKSAANRMVWNGRMGVLLSREILGSSGDPVVSRGSRCGEWLIRGLHRHPDLGMIEELTDLLVGRLSEVFVPGTDGVEGVGHDAADARVALVAERGIGRGCDGRGGDDQSGGPKPADGLDGGPHRRTGRDPVVHQDHDAAAHVRWGAVAAIEPLPA